MDDEILAVYYLECALFLSSFLLMRHEKSKINRTTRINNLVVVVVILRDNFLKLYCDFS